MMYAKGDVWFGRMNKMSAFNRFLTFFISFYSLLLYPLWFCMYRYYVVLAGYVGMNTYIYLYQPLVFLFFSV